MTDVMADEGINEHIYTSEGRNFFHKIANISQINIYAPVIFSTYNPKL